MHLGGRTLWSQMVHGVMKAKGINVGKTKIGTILGEISPEAQTNGQKFTSRSLNPKVYNSKYFGHKIR